MLESLKNNEFLPNVTFETFLAKKTNRGKRTIFNNKPTSENSKSMSKQYMMSANANALAKAEKRVQEVED